MRSLCCFPYVLIAKMLFTSKCQSWLLQTLTATRNARLPDMNEALAEQSDRSAHLHSFLSLPHAASARFQHHTVTPGSMCEPHFTVGRVVQKVPSQRHLYDRGPADRCSGRWRLFGNLVTYGPHSQQCSVLVTLWPDCSDRLRLPPLVLLMLLKHPIQYVPPHPEERSRRITFTVPYCGRHYSH